MLQRLMPYLRHSNIALLIGVSLGMGYGAAETGMALTLSVQDDLLSIRSQAEPLGAVLAELARQTGMQVYVTEAEAARKVSVSFDALPLQEGIGRLLQGFNYTLRLAPAPTVDGRRQGLIVSEIRVFDRGEPSATGRQVRTPSARTRPEAPSKPGRGPQPAPVRPLSLLIQDAYSAPEPLDRMRALAMLGRRMEESEAVLPTLLDALQDEHDDVRKEALGLLSQTETPAVIEAMSRVALTDVSPRLRLSALSLLAKTRGPIARRTLEQALQDPEPQIQARLQALLEQWGSKP